MSLLNYIGGLDDMIGAAPYGPVRVPGRTGDRRTQSSPGGGGGGGMYNPGQGWAQPGGQYADPYAMQAYSQGYSPQQIALAAAAAAQRDARARAASALTPIAPGVPVPGWREEPLGFANFSFTATSGLLLQQQANPQRPFKGRRLVIDFVRTGTTATGLLTVNAILVGSNNVLVSAQPVPVSMFAGNSWGVDLSIPECTPGVLITLQIALSAAPTMTDNIVVSAGIIGLSWS